MKFHKITRTFRHRLVLVEFISVARVRPRTSKGITDLLLPQTSVRWKTHSPSKKKNYFSEEKTFYLAG